MEGTAYPPNKSRYYSVFRYGKRSTVRYFTNMKDALKYYDAKCKIRNFRSISLCEHDMQRTPIIKEIYSTDWLGSGEIRDLGKR